MELYQAFRTQLEELGFREGRNLTIDYQGVDDPRGPFVVAAELRRAQPDLIVATGSEAASQAVAGASGIRSSPNQEISLKIQQAPTMTTTSIIAVAVFILRRLIAEAQWFKKQ
jgi:hypothetical protein